MTDLRWQCNTLSSIFWVPFFRLLANHEGGSNEVHIFDVVVSVRTVATRCQRPIISQSTDLSDILGWTHLQRMMTSTVLFSAIILQHRLF